MAESIKAEKEKNDEGLVQNKMFFIRLSREPS